MSLEQKEKQITLFRLTLEMLVRQEIIANKSFSDSLASWVLTFESELM